MGTPSCIVNWNWNYIFWGTASESSDVDTISPPPPHIYTYEVLFEAPLGQYSYKIGLTGDECSKLIDRGATVPVGAAEVGYTPERTVWVRLGGPGPSFELHFFTFPVRLLKFGASNPPRRNPGYGPDTSISFKDIKYISSFFRRTHTITYF